MTALEQRLDRLFFSLPYRYELLVGTCFVSLLFWWMYGGFQAFVASFTILLVVLDARSASQAKRLTEDLTMIDRILGSIPFRYEFLCLVSLALAVLWYLAAGWTGFMFGLAIFVLALRARSSSQFKRQSAVTLNEVD